MASRVFGILRVADVPHIAYLAAERPLHLTLATDHYTGYYPGWSDALAARATMGEAFGRDDGVAWLVSVLR
jgi:hypothetical protein